jgi:hypothetical protein
MTPVMVIVIVQKLELDAVELGEAATLSNIGITDLNGL